MSTPDTFAATVGNVTSDAPSPAVGPSSDGRAPVYTTESKAIREPLSEDKLKQEMAATLDKIEKANAREVKAHPSLPSAGHVVYTDDRGDRRSAKVGESIAETMEAAYEWSQKPLADRKEIASATKALEERRLQNAELGLTEAERVALEQTEALKQATVQPEWQAFSDKVAKAAPDRKATEVADHLWELGEWYERDTPAVVKMLAEHKGRADLLAEPYHQIAERYRETLRGQQPLQAYEKLLAASDFLDRQPAEGLKWLANSYGFDVDLRKRAAGQPRGWEDTMRAVAAGMR